MKKIVFILSLVLVFSACGEKKVEEKVEENEVVKVDNVKQVEVEIVSNSDENNPESIESYSEFPVNYVNPENGESTPAKVVDKETFKKISEFYFKDKNNVYFFIGGGEYIKLKNTNIETFEILGDRYAKDKNNFYADYKVMKNVDKDTFKVLNKVFAKDKNNVYYLGDIFSNVDVESFVAVDDVLAKDKNNCYLKNDIHNMSECNNVKNQK